ncbi:MULTISPECIES: hypothetical protein [Lactobacillus]|uniref:Uncharacterized protein n=1 Tax=Lactobacillus xujianguonis TaxID=2495899 RepID=A0A437SXP8_9LACO|nr:MULTISPECIES: hypothetical protein [Lactobacillus]RVU71587.1 hypothetical protein EJK17_01010 [Lactobacillus xujianguonis]RVU77761.1 hypothetical protein EJK20_00690 [Lactobacillus xujianguonis]
MTEQNNSKELASALEAEKHESPQMLAEALREVMLYLHDENNNPVSLSMELYNLGIRDEKVKDKLLLKTIEVYNHTENPENLTLADFTKEFKKIHPFLNFDPITAYILNWIGRWQAPKIYPLAQDLMSELEN